MVQFLVNEEGFRPERRILKEYRNGNPLSMYSNQIGRRKVIFVPDTRSRRPQRGVPTRVTLSCIGGDAALRCPRTMADLSLGMVASRSGDLQSPFNHLRFSKPPIISKGRSKIAPPWVLKLVTRRS